MASINPVPPARQDLTANPDRAHNRYFPNDTDTLVALPDITPAETYDKLICTDDDRKNICLLIKYLGESSYTELYNRYDEMTDLGQNVAHVHPLKFLSAILNNPEARKSFHQLCYGESFPYPKWCAFFWNLKKNLKKNDEKDNLMKFIKSFADEIHRPIESLQPFFESKNWKALVLFLDK